jgi:hypothetical protein
MRLSRGSPLDGGTPRAKEGVALSSRTSSSHSPQNARLERVTVNLTPRAWQALNQAVKLTGDSKTDTINRALQLYAYLEEITQSGGALYVRSSGQKELEQLRFF